MSRAIERLAGARPGETVTCTFTNTQRGKIIVEKQTLPDGSSQSFEFDPSYGANFFLTDGQQNDAASWSRAATRSPSSCLRLGT